MKKNTLTKTFSVFLVLTIILFSIQLIIAQEASGWDELEEAIADIQSTGQLNNEIIQELSSDNPSLTSLQKIEVIAAIEPNQKDFWTQWRTLESKPRNALLAELSQEHRDTFMSKYAQSLELPQNAFEGLYNDDTKFGEGDVIGNGKANLDVSKIKSHNKGKTVTETEISKVWKRALLKKNRGWIYGEKTVERIIPPSSDHIIKVTHKKENGIDTMAIGKESGASATVKVGEEQNGYHIDPETGKFSRLKEVDGKNVPDFDNPLTGTWDGKGNLVIDATNNKVKLTLDSNKGEDGEADSKNFAQFTTSDGKQFGGYKKPEKGWKELVDGEYERIEEEKLHPAEITFDENGEIDILSNAYAKIDNHEFFTGEDTKYFSDYEGYEKFIKENKDLDRNILVYDQEHVNKDGTIGLIVQDTKGRSIYEDLIPKIEGSLKNPKATPEAQILKNKIQAATKAGDTEEVKRLNKELTKLIQKEAQELGRTLRSVSSYIQEGANEENAPDIVRNLQIGFQEAEDANEGIFKDPKKLDWYKQIKDMNPDKLSAKDIDFLNGRVLSDNGNLLTSGTAGANLVGLRGVDVIFEKNQKGEIKNIYYNPNPNPNQDQTDIDKIKKAYKGKEIRIVKFSQEGVNWESQRALIEAASSVVGSGLFAGALAVGGVPTDIKGVLGGGIKETLSTELGFQNKYHPALDVLSKPEVLSNLGTLIELGYPEEGERNIGAIAKQGAKFIATIKRTSEDVQEYKQGFMRTNIGADIGNLIINEGIATNKDILIKGGLEGISIGRASLSKKDAEAFDIGLIQGKGINEFSITSDQYGRTSIKRIDSELVYFGNTRISDSIKFEDVRDEYDKRGRLGKRIINNKVVGTPLTLGNIEVSIDQKHANKLAKLFTGTSETNMKFYAELADSDYKIEWTGPIGAGGGLIGKMVNKKLQQQMPGQIKKGLGRLEQMKEGLNSPLQFPEGSEGNTREFVQKNKNTLNRIVSDIQSSSRIAPPNSELRRAVFDLTDSGYSYNQIDSKIRSELIDVMDHISTSIKQSGYNVRSLSYEGGSGLYQLKVNGKQFNLDPDTSALTHIAMPYIIESFAYDNQNNNLIYNLQPGSRIFQKGQRTISSARTTIPQMIASTTGLSSGSKITTTTGQTEITKGPSTTSSGTCNNRGCKARKGRRLFSRFRKA